MRRGSLDTCSKAALPALAIAYLFPAASAAPAPLPALPIVGPVGPTGPCPQTGSLAGVPKLDASPVALASPGQADLSIDDFSQPAACQDGVIDTVLEPGTYWLWSGPQSSALEVDCGTIYEIRLTCEAP